ncbi:MAG: methyltransferase domain-containing protein [Myxococcales bacterium]|nr:methyltransferase domain-containing protein [Myxococcales bacterium]
MDIEAAAGRYAPLGRTALGFARGKMRYDPAYAAVMPYLRDGHVVLDVGCGEGYLLALASTVYSDLTVVGIDHDGRRLGQARVALEDLDARFVEGDARSVHLPDADVISCLDVLHYQSPDAQDALLARLAGALRPGGVLLVRDAEARAGIRSAITALTERVAMALGRHRGDGVFLRPRGELRGAMEGAGLTVEDVDCAEGTAFSNVLFVGRAP